MIRPSIRIPLLFSLLLLPLSLLSAESYEFRYEAPGVGTETIATKRMEGEVEIGGIRGGEVMETFRPSCRGWYS